MKTFFSTLIILFLSINLSAQGYQIGDKAISFNLLNVDGKFVALDDYGAAKGFVIIFTCNHCPFSVAYEDRIIALDQKYKDLGYPVLAINPNDSLRAPSDSYSHMIVRAREKGFTFPYLLDADQSIAKAYGATRTPHVYILKKEHGALVVKYIGAIDDNHEEAQKVKSKFVEEALDDLLAGNNPKRDFTKAIGCSIKFEK